MSVEEARLAAEVAASDYRWKTVPTYRDAVDRLILEVQAAMPCYFTAAVRDGVLLDATELGVRLCVSARWDKERCPACTARDKLKEAA